MKKYILIAGVNGAGKSTLFHMLPELKEYPRVNSDEIVKEFGEWNDPIAVLKAGKLAVENICIKVVKQRINRLQRVINTSNVQ